MLVTLGLSESEEVVLPVTATTVASNLFLAKLASVTRPSGRRTVCAPTTPPGVAKVKDLPSLDFTGVDVTAVPTPVESLIKVRPLTPATWLTSSENFITKPLPLL
ncbi:hypothetical protein D3C73_976930 [compost metagenome]